MCVCVRERERERERQRQRQRQRQRDRERQRETERERLSVSLFVPVPVYVCVLRLCMPMSVYMSVCLPVRARAGVCVQHQCFASYHKPTHSVLCCDHAVSEPTAQSSQLPAAGVVPCPSLSPLAPLDCLLYLSLSSLALSKCSVVPRH